MDTLPYKIENGIIIFNNDFNKSIDPYLDVLSKYEKLKFGSYFNKSVDNLPNNIKQIEFGLEFN
jgi:hypothetical protein